MLPSRLDMNIGHYVCVKLQDQRWSSVLWKGRIECDLIAGRTQVQALYTHPVIVCLGHAFFLVFFGFNRGFGSMLQLGLQVNVCRGHATSLPSSP